MTINRLRVQRIEIRRQRPLRRTGRPRLIALDLAVLFALWFAIAPVSRAVCDGCVVAAIERHKAEMVNQFSQLKSVLGDEFKKLRDQLSAEVKTVRQSVAQVEKDSLRAQMDVNFMLPSGGCETGTGAEAAGPARDRVEAYARALNHLARKEQNGSAAAIAMLDAQISAYCAPDDVGKRGCEQASARPNAQFLLETLLSGSGAGDGIDPTQPTRAVPELM